MIIVIPLVVMAAPALFFAIGGAKGLITGELYENSTVICVTLLWLSVIVALGFIGLLLK